MDIVLNWNVVLSAAIIALFSYHFLLGQNGTVKLILSIYIAILTADGIATLIKEVLVDPSPGFQQLLGANEESIFTIIRLVLFLITIITFVVRGAFHVSISSHEHWVGRSAVHGIFSFLGAMVFLATILIYLSGSSYVEGMLYASDINIYRESWIARVLIDGYQVWFSLPAIMFLVSSFLFPQKD